VPGRGPSHPAGSDRIASIPLLNPNPIIEVSSAGDVTFCNQAARTLAAELGAKGPAAFLPETLPDILEVLKRGERTAFLREVKVGAAIFAESIYIAPEFNAVRIYAVDITERRRAQEALRESEERFRGVFAASPIGMAVADRDGRLLNVNPALCILLGYSEPELLKLSFRDITYPEDVGESRRFMQALADGTVPGSRIEKRYRTKQGGEVWASTTATTIGVGAGGAVRGLVMIEDITERRQAEQARRESERRLRDAQALGRIGSWEFILGTRTIAWSEETFALYERDPAKGPPTEGEEAGYYEREQAARLRELAARVIADGTPAECDLEAELPSGRTAYFHMTMRPLTDSAGRVISVYGTVQDITERKRAEQGLRESEERFRALYAGIADAVLVHRLTPDGRPGRIVEANDVACRMLGHPRDELVGTKVTDLSAYSLASDSQGIVEQLRSGKDVLFQRVLVARGGRQLFVEVHARMFTYDGEPAVISVLRDVTDRSLSSPAQTPDPKS
jgi:PAS domain S-box-containing protein